MSKRVKSTEAFDANAKTTEDLEGVIVSRYMPTGPNKWDDMELERDDGTEKVSVPSGTRVQVEPIGANPEVCFRMRKGRKVLVIRWVLTDADEKEVASGKWGVQEAEQASFIEKVLGLAPKNDPRDDMLEYFLAKKAEPKE